MILRISIVILIAFVYLLSFSHIKSSKHYQFIAISMSIICLIIAIIFTFFDGVDESYLYTGNLILIVYVFTLLSIRFEKIKFLALFFIITHLIVLYLNFDFTIEKFTHQAYGVIVITIAGLLSNYMIELQRRQNFLNKKIINEQKDVLRNNIIEKDKLLKTLKEQNIELDAFNHSVSHDLKAPIRNISAFSQLLEKHHKDSLNKQGLEYLKFITYGTNKMNKLVNDLLHYSKVKKTELSIQQIDMNNMVDIIFWEQSRTLQKQAILTKSNLPSINGDKILLKQVWQNLISNAIKYSSKKDVIKINISSIQSSTEITYIIKDNGIGFDMKYAEKLFEIFRRLHATDKDFSGTGVGLSLVNRIIKKHNGKIWAESEPNKGSIFYFTIPLNLSNNKITSMQKLHLKII